MSENQTPKQGFFVTASFEKYHHFKRDQVVTLEIHPRAFKDNVYYSNER